MRRNRTNSGRRKSLRRGVIARVITRKRKVQSPVAWVMNSIGFAPKLSVNPLHTSSRAGTRQSAKTGTFIRRLPRTRFHRMLEVLPQIHAGVKMGHLIGVPVEWERLAFEELSQPPFGGLAPARMIDLRVHI